MKMLLSLYGDIRLPFVANFPKHSAITVANWNAKHLHEAGRCSDPDVPGIRLCYLSSRDGGNHKAQSPGFRRAYPYRRGSPDFVSLL